MVFESIVVDLINRYLGDFVENLDSSQLKIGLWGGDVVLKNLNLKESALDELDLPVKVKAGHIGQLTLKIPWKNLYTEPVVAEIDGIYALAVPNVGIKYEVEKEKKSLQDDKQAKLQAIESAKKQEKEKDKPRDPKQDSFAEKLATQVIKNLQVTVSSIHVRYEDKYTNPSRPFAIGASLQELVFHTTDENWKETIIKEAVTQIYKLIRLDSFCVYWNSNSTMVQDKSPGDILEYLKTSVAKESQKPNLQYLFKPISAVAHLRLNTKPEQQEFTIPKIFLTLVFDEIAAVLDKTQYDDILEMLESLERMNLKAIYRKTRPEVAYKGHAKEWWHHGYAVILEHIVQRRRKMWDWREIKKHRDFVHKYIGVYAKKLSSKKLSSADADLLKELEEKLDVFNIALCRNQAEMKVEKEVAIKAEEKEKAGWFGGWFGGGKKKSTDDVDSGGAIGQQFQKEFNSEEKQKLFKAIGYDETTTDPTLPVEFVAVRVVTKLNRVSVGLTSNANREYSMMKLTLSDIYTSFSQRPSENAIRVDAKVERLKVVGSSRANLTPKMVTSIKEDGTSLLSILFETNPLDKECDSRIRVLSKPLEIVYDAITINNLASFFKPPETVRLKELSKGAMAKYEEIKEQTASSMVYAMEGKKYADIEVNLMPSYIIIPHGGELSKDGNMLLLNLGCLKVSSQKNNVEGSDGSKLTTEEAINLSYDKFNISLDNVQLLFAQPGDSWNDPQKIVSSPLYILRPMSINLLLEKCIFAADPNMPLIRLKGELPLISVGVSDGKLLSIMKLAKSIPLPESAEVEEFEEAPDEAVFVPATSLATKRLVGSMNRSVTFSKGIQEFKNLTQLAASFVIKQVDIQLMETQDSTDVPFLTLSVENIGADVFKRTFDVKVDAQIGAISLEHMQIELTDGTREQLMNCGIEAGDANCIINCPIHDPNTPLISLNVLQADPKGPEFANLYNNTQQALTLQFTTMNLIFHQAVIHSLMKFAQKLETSQPEPVQRLTTRRSSMVSSLSIKIEEEAKKIKTKKAPENMMQLKVNALVDNIKVGLCSENYLITMLNVGGIEVSFAMYTHLMGVEAVLRRVEIFDPDAKTLHSKIIDVGGTEVLRLELKQYLEATAKTKNDDITKMDTEIDLRVGRIRIVFVNKFIKSLLNFIENFSAARVKLDEAQQKVKEVGTDVAKNLRENKRKLKLNILVKAPIVVVPRHSRSPEALLVNLGDVSIMNVFAKIESRTFKGGQFAVVETLSVNLDHLQASRILTKGEQAEHEILILEPLKLSVDVKRNLSDTWYTGIPSVSINSVVQSISVKLSFEDLCTFMLLMNENLEEEKPYSSSFHHDETQTERTSTEGHVEQVTEIVSNIETTVSVAQDLEIVAEEAFTKVKVDFKLTAIVVQLYKGSSNLKTCKGVRPREEMLTEISLNNFGMDFAMISDTSMAIIIFLQDIHLDDQRSEKKGGLTKMICRSAAIKMRRSSFSESDTEKAIEILFDQNSEEDKKIKLNVCALSICVCMDFLMRVVDFFTKAMPQDKPKTYKDIEKRKDKSPSKKGGKEIDSDDALASTKKGTMDIQLNLAKPEIVLIEDQMNPNTNSLVVDVTVNLRVLITPHSQSINGAINSLSLVSCIHKDPDTIRNVLAPCDISLISNAPEGKDHHIDINVTDFVFTLTPATIRLLSSIAAGMVPSKEDDATVIVKAKDHSQIWEKKSLANCSFWFTHSGSAENEEFPEKEATEEERDKGVERGEQRGEKLMLAIPVIVFKLEGGVGYRTIPLIALESSFQAEVKDWSSKLNVESNLSVEVAYYNEDLDVWEPIIEPVMQPGSKQYKQWELGVEVMTNDELILEDDSEDAPVLLPSKKLVNVTASEPLEILMTKTCLDVLNNLGTVFNEAYNLRSMPGKLNEVIMPLVFKNKTGETIRLGLDASMIVAEVSQDVDPNNFKNGEHLQIDMNDKQESNENQNFVIRASERSSKRFSFKLLTDNEMFENVIDKTCQRVFPLDMKSPSGGTCYALCEVETEIGQKIVTMASIMKVRNFLSIPMEVFFISDKGPLSCGVVHPDNCFAVPLQAIYSKDSCLYFKPVDEDNYVMSDNEAKWTTLENDKVEEVKCSSTKEGEPAYFFNVLVEKTQAQLELKQDKFEDVITLNLHPTVILHNLLPYDINMLLEGSPDSSQLKTGNHMALPHASVDHTNMELMIPEYNGMEWSGRKLIKLDVPPLSIWNFSGTDESGQTFVMELGLHSKVVNGSYDLTLYSPYWIVNKSQQDISLKEDNKAPPFTREAGQENVLLFFFKDRPIFNTGKKKKDKESADKKNEKSKEVKAPGKVQLKMGAAEWSDKFSLDTVGSNGNVVCKAMEGGHSLEAGVQIQLSSSGLTKIVTFTPFYMLLNLSQEAICVQEEGCTTWKEIAPDECCAYYPETLTKDKNVKVKVKVKDSDMDTVYFFLNKAHTTLLKLENSYGGINVSCQVQDSSMITTFNLYEPGMATVLFVNETPDCTLTIKQSSMAKDSAELQAQTALMYTWDEPTGERLILWTCGKQKQVKAKVDQDGIGEFNAADKTKVYWVSFLDGMQRVLMFTQDLALATIAQAAGELEQSDLEVNLRIHDLGFSLINNQKMIEVAYMGISSSGIIWEEKKKRYKAMTVKNSMALEQGYQKHLMEVSLNKKKPGHTLLENKLEVDYDKMEMIRPRKAMIRRSFESGIFVQFKQSTHAKQLHSKINRLQFDNQLRHAVFPTVLSPVAQPKSVAAESVPKPFVEVSLMMRIHEHSSLNQIKYFKVLVQEMDLKIDHGFLNAVIDLFTSQSDLDRDKEVTQFKTDMESLSRDLKEEAGLSKQQAQPNFYDYFHISPLKIHVSFTLQGGGSEEGSAALHSNVLNVFLQSVGVVITDVQDVIFKLGYFQREHCFYTNPQLTSEFIHHYASQAVKQMYVLVLGLDVLGNPFGLLRGLSEGIEDLFYEPFQGAIQGPEEFAEGLALGVRSLFGHAVGGAAGAVGRIAGTLGKGLAALTLDDDYQKKRRAQLNRKPESAKEGFARGGKGLVMGVFDGVTGIVRKPMEGAKQEGAKGFFKGMGKGLVGVVTRPTSGVVDFASSSLEGIRRITDMTEDIHRLRPPRHLNKDGIVLPYCREEAEGYNLLVETDKGRYASTDEYLWHIKLRKDGKLVFIITDRHVMMAKRGDIFGAWDTDWVYSYEEMKSIPKQNAKGIEIVLKEEKKKLFGSNVSKKEVPITDANTAKIAVEKIQQAVEKLNLENVV